MRASQTGEFPDTWDWEPVLMAQPYPKNNEELIKGPKCICVW